MGIRVLKMAKIIGIELLVQTEENIFGKVLNLEGFFYGKVYICGKKIHRKV